MTLGRTASNAIKIKTDGTTRAVECACCDPCASLPDPSTICILGAKPTSGWIKDPNGCYIVFSYVDQGDPFNPFYPIDYLTLGVYNTETTCYSGATVRASMIFTGVYFFDTNTYLCGPPPATFYACKENTDHLVFGNYIVGCSGGPLLKVEEC